MVARNVLADAFHHDFSMRVIEDMLRVSVAQAAEVPGLAGDAEFAGFRLAQERLQALAFERTAA